MSITEPVSRLDFDEPFLGHGDFVGLGRSLIGRHRLLLRALLWGRYDGAHYRINAPERPVEEWEPKQRVS